MQKQTFQLLLIGLVVGMLAVTATYAASNSEQVVFSTPGFFPMTLTGTAPNGGNLTPLGFWVWCIAEPGAPQATESTVRTKLAKGPCTSIS